MRGRGLFAAAVGLWLAAFARDGVDRWIDATVLPPLSPAISQEVVDRNGVLLRAYTVEDGRWRLGVDGGQVDPFFIALLLDYEDKRFYQHHGVDPLALLRAVGQAVWNGQVVSGGSTLTMQVARLMEGSGTGRVAGKLRRPQGGMFVDDYKFLHSIAKATPNSIWAQRAKTRGQSADLARSIRLSVSVCKAKRFCSARRLSRISQAFFISSRFMVEPLC